MATAVRQWCEPCQEATESWTDVDGRVYCSKCEPPEKIYWLGEECPRCPDCGGHAHGPCEYR